MDRPYVSTRPVSFGTDTRNCAGDICLAGVQENDRRVEEARQSLYFELGALPILSHMELFHGSPVGMLLLLLNCLQLVFIIALCS